MGYTAEWSALQRGLIDGVIQRGNQETLSGTIQSSLTAITCGYIKRSRSEDSLNKHLQDTWYTLIQAGKHIATHEVHQDLVVRELVTIRTLGLLQRSAPTGADVDNDFGMNPGDPQGIITFSDGNTFWTGLPLLSMCLTDEFTKRYYEKDYSKEQRDNMAGFIGRLLAAGFYDGPALCALSLFRETLETPRPLVEDEISKEDSAEIHLPVEDLLDALTGLCHNSRFGLALLSSSQTSETTARTIKTNPAEYLHLSGLGELALQSGIIADFPPSGYSSQRWSFWVQRLAELTRCGIRSIEHEAKSCLTGMKWAGDDTELLPKLIREELITWEEDEEHTTQ
ncbi:unnamed protein product [Clonostachys byssicola]|uniref:Uncharacterized protein n=1 Tax=Clonostachys byssicola TaxID=160290 RepID=A0A9N9XXM7_9HYPO|nr:unnamed protein product [Clonostachys byssicola]